MNLKNAICSRLWALSGLDRECAFLLRGSRTSPTYYIVRRILGWGADGGGFFANFFFALSHIAYAKEKGWIPVVDMQNYRTLYSEKQPIDGITNAWDYFFSQPVDTRAAYRSRRFVLSNGRTLQQRWKPFQDTPSAVIFDNNMMSYLSVLAKEYTQIRPTLLAEFSHYASISFQGKKILGIHYRGTDKRIPPPGHYSSPSSSNLLSSVRRLLGRCHPDAIFLATDEKGIAETIAHVFAPIPVISTNAFRMQSNSRNGLHTSRAIPRPLHRYRLGVEVLQDAWLLSRCDFLIYGHSNVTNAARFFRGKDWEDSEFLLT